MTYRKLGRTGFKSSRLVFGGGAALAGGRAVRLLDRALEAGINHFDVGSNVYYRGAERSMAPFLKANRDKVWVASKAPLMIRLKPEDSITVEQAKSAAAGWLKLLDASLKDLGVSYVDLYYLMAVDNPSLISSEEIYNAFLAAKKAGKVGYFGISTHKNAQQLLETAIETGWYDVAMIGITPAGWYDWEAHDLVSGTPALTKLEPLLKRARDAGIGLVGMKTVRHLAPKSALGKGVPGAFDKYYSKTFIASPLTPFQRAYAYALGHGLDVVNADMQNFKHLEENIIAASTSHKYFA
jgi:aryl-alcohol dehydrogenase-like predicted oxidoreductase